MKTIGLIGGMSWQSSLEYYKIINKTMEERLGGLHSAKCIMHSVDFEEIEVLQHQGNWGELSKIMVEIAKKLKNSGADFILICTNTMHKLASDIENLAKIDVLHIAEATGRAIKEKGVSKVGLLGTKFTMEGDFYKKILNEKFNIEVIIPTQEQRDVIHDVIYNELCKGIIKQSSKDEYIKIIKDLALNGANGIVLGCTEIPLLIKQEDVDISVFDTTMLHAIEAVNFAISK